MNDGDPHQKSKLTIEFDNPEALKHFALWLCESGEQGYWEWMEYREEEQPGPITATKFHYHGVEDPTKAQTDPTRYGTFLGDDTIRTTCGRKSGEDLDEDDPDSEDENE